MAMNKTVKANGLDVKALSKSKIEKASSQKIGILDSLYMLDSGYYIACLLGIIFGTFVRNMAIWLIFVALILYLIHRSRNMARASNNSADETQTTLDSFKKDKI